MMDMSSKAVTERLRLMDELWLLSVKLMNSKLVTRHAGPTRKEREQRTQNAIRQILFHDWDPIGISKDSTWDDEYDAYIAPIYRILVGTRSEEEIVNRLLQMERDSMGVAREDRETLRPVARKLLELDT
jgi:hypothetical protein